MSAVRTPQKFYGPLAAGAPAPLRQLPVRLERMIHFVPPDNALVRRHFGPETGPFGKRVIGIILRSALSCGFSRMPVSRGTEGP